MIFQTEGANVQRRRLWDCVAQWVGCRVWWAKVRLQRGGEGYVIGIVDTLQRILFFLMLIRSFQKTFSRAW